VPILPLSSERPLLLQLTLFTDTNNPNQTNPMGDKSPKSKQKDQSQKQGKTDAAAKAKKRLVDSKKTQVPPPPSKSKK